MTFLIALVFPTAAALAVLAYDLFATRNPFTGDPR